MNHHWYLMISLILKVPITKKRLKPYENEWINISSYGLRIRYCLVPLFSCATFYLILQWIKRIYYLEIHSLLNTVWFDFFLKTMIPRDRWLRHWFGGLVWCLVLLVGRLLRDSLRPSSLFSLAKYQQPNDITKKRSRKRKSSKIDHRKKYIPIKIRGSVARTIRTCVGIVSTCVKLGFIGVCYSAARQFIIHEHSWTGLDLISPKREQRLKRENFQRVNRIRWGSGLYR